MNKTSALNQKTKQLVLLAVLTSVVSSNLRVYRPDRTVAVEVWEEHQALGLMQCGIRCAVTGCAAMLLQDGG